MPIGLGITQGGRNGLIDISPVNTETFVKNGAIVSQLYMSVTNSSGSSLTNATISDLTSGVSVKDGYTIPSDIPAGGDIHIPLDYIVVDGGIGIGGKIRGKHGSVIGSTTLSGVSTVIGEMLTPTVYVAKTGNDATGDGSYGNPYLTVSKGMSVLQPGDILSISAGTYSENLGSSDFTWMEANAYGADESGIVTIMSNPGDSVTIENSIQAANTTAMSLSSSNYIDFVGIKFDGSLNLLSPRCASVYGTSTNIRFFGCEFNGVDIGERISITTCSKEDCGYFFCKFSNSSEHGIYLSTHDTGGVGDGPRIPDNVIIYGCEFTNIADYGIHMNKEDAVSDPSDIMLVRNYCHDCGSGGMVLAMGDNGLIASSVFSGNTNYGIWIGYRTSTNTNIVNNTIHNNNLYGIRIDDESDGAYLANNIFSSNTLSDVFTVDGSYGINTTWVSNLSSDSSMPWHNTCLLSEDPVFISSTTDVTISPLSPCAGAGSVTSSIVSNVDFFGVEYDSVNNDIGACHSYSGEMLADNMLNWWKMSNRTSGDIIDHAGSNDMTAYMGQSLYFNNSSAGYTLSTDQLISSVLGTTSTLSVGAKVYRELASPGYDVIFGGAYYRRPFALMLSAGVLVFNVYSGTEYTWTSTNPIISSDGWYDIHVYFDPASSTMKFYSNGSEVTGTWSATPPTGFTLYNYGNSRDSIVIGSDSTDGGTTFANHFEGSIYRVFVSSTLVSVDDGTTILNSSPQRIVHPSNSIIVTLDNGSGLVLTDDTDTYEFDLGYGDDTGWISGSAASGIPQKLFGLGSYESNSRGVSHNGVEVGLLYAENSSFSLPSGQFTLKAMIDVSSVSISDQYILSTNSTASNGEGVSIVSDSAYGYYVEVVGVSGTSYKIYPESRPTGFVNVFIRNTVDANTGEGQVSVLEFDSTSSLYTLVGSTIKTTDIATLSDAGQRIVVFAKASDLSSWVTMQCSISSIQVYDIALTVSEMTKNHNAERHQY